MISDENFHVAKGNFEQADSTLEVMEKTAILNKKKKCFDCLFAKIADM